MIFVNILNKTFTDYPPDNIYQIPQKNKKITKKTKGIKLEALKELSFDDYYQCLYLQLNQRK